MTDLLKEFEWPLSNLIDKADKEIALLDPEVSDEDYLINRWEEIRADLILAYNDITTLKEKLKKQAV